MQSQTIQHQLTQSVSNAEVALMSISSHAKQANSTSHLQNLITFWLSQIKQSILLHNKIPIYSFSQVLNPKTMKFQLKRMQKFVLNTNSLSKFVRLLEILRIVQENLANNRTITKRNLFYMLEHYYNGYRIVDHDIRLICYNLYYLQQQIKQQNVNEANQWRMERITKNDLGIIASNRCIIFGCISLIVDGKPLVSKSGQLLTIPTCKQILPKCPIPSTMIIIQKQSIFQSLCQAWKQHPHLSSKYTLLSAKGYPDWTTRQLLKRIVQARGQEKDESVKLYYLGDYDVYGFDIAMQYAIGDWLSEGIIQSMEILEIKNNKPNGDIINWKQLLPQMNKFNKQDHVKIKQLSKKFSCLLQSKQQFHPSIRQKILKMERYFNKFVSQGLKCQLQLFAQCAYSPTWVAEIIQFMQNKKQF